MDNEFPLYSSRKQANLRRNKQPTTEQHQQVTLTTNNKINNRRLCKKLYLKLCKYGFHLKLIIQNKEKIRMYVFWVVFCICLHLEIVNLQVNLKWMNKKSTEAIREIQNLLLGPPISKTSQQEIEVMIEKLFLPLLTTKNRSSITNLVF